MFKRILFIGFLLLLAIGIYASEADDLFSQGDTAYKAKDYTKAFDIFGKLVKLEPQSAKYQYNLGLAARKLNKYTIAASALLEAQKLDPAIGFTGDKTAFQDKLEEMTRLADSENNEGSGVKEFAAGEAAYKSGDYQAAYNAFVQAVAKQPEIAKYQYNLGLACRKLDKYTEAYRALNEARRIDPDITFTDNKDDYLAKIDEMAKLAAENEPDAGLPETETDTAPVKPGKSNWLRDIFLWIVGLSGGGAIVRGVVRSNRAKKAAQGTPQGQQPPGATTTDDGYDKRYTNYTPGQSSTSTRDHS